MATKTRRKIEIYEDYWKFTASWTNLYGTKFNNCLNIIINYIDQNWQAITNLSESDFRTSNIYTKLQQNIAYAMNFKGSDANLSARKAVNMFVKLGFINPYLKGYHKLVKKFILTNIKEQKQILFSKIFYESSSLASDVTCDNRHLKHISFFLRTLDKNRVLNSNDLKALMVTDITQFKKGYLTREELNSQYRYAMANAFEERKYNQISHLKSYLSNFIDIVYDKRNDEFKFATDIDIVNEEVRKSYQRDPIKYRIYRTELKQESVSVYGKEVCYVEKKPFKGLTASHIKPSHICLREHNDDQAYDVNNGLLLSPNVDAYFDKFDITFDDNGKIIFGKQVPLEIRRELEFKGLDKIILNDDRKIYMSYHRKTFSERNELN